MFIVEEKTGTLNVQFGQNDIIIMSGPAAGEKKVKTAIMSIIDASGLDEIPIQVKQGTLDHEIGPVKVRLAFTDVKSLDWFIKELMKMRSMLAGKIIQLDGLIKGN